MEVKVRKILMLLIVFGSLQATPETEQDIDVVLQTIHEKGEKVEKIVEDLALLCLEDHEKTMDIKVFKEKILCFLNSPEFNQPFYQFFTTHFTAEEIRELRMIHEEEVFQKYIKRFMEINNLFFETLLESGNAILDEDGVIKSEKNPCDSKVIEIYGKDFKNVVEKAKGYVIVDVYANWCGPCKKMKPIFDELSCTFPDIKFVKINSDEANEISKKYKIRYLPTFLFFKNGKEVDRKEGFFEKNDFKKKIEDLIG